MAEIASFGVDVDENTKLAQNAQDTADDANKKNSDNSQQIANINDPNYLTPFEKPQLEIQMDNFATVYATDKDIAEAEGIDFTSYDAAYQAYLAYMKPLTADISTYSPIVRSTFNSMVTAVQAEQKHFNAATQAQYNQQIKQAQTDIDDGQTKYKALQSEAETMVKKGDVASQLNLDAGGALLQTVGGNTKIVLSAPNIIFDTVNPVQIPSANIEGTLTGKTFEAGTITATTKITGADIEAPIIHSPSGSFKLDGNTGDIVGASIHATDNSWRISSAGKIHGTSITASVMDISGDGNGPNFDAVNVTPDTTQGIYSRYKYSVNAGFDVNGSSRKLYKNGYLVINGDTFLNRTIGDWSADGGGKYVYDTMYEAHTIKMRAYNYTGSNVQTDDPGLTQGSISSRLDIQPSAITMSPDWSVANPNILIDNSGRGKFGMFAINSAHSVGTTDGGDLYFMKMNNDATNVGGSSIPIHVKKLFQSSLLSLKTDIKPVDPNTALEAIDNTDFMSYHFKDDKSNEPVSISPILDDINPIPKYNTPDIFKSADGTGRNDGNILGYTALAVKSLYAKIKDLTDKVNKLEGAK